MPTMVVPDLLSPAKRAPEIGEHPLCKGSKDGWTTKDQSL